MPGLVEQTYGNLFRYAKTFINPFKKAVIQTECIIHQYINFQGIEILKNDRYMDAFTFFSDYVTQLNKGVVWADQDLKSSNHFYSPIKDRGLYGNSNALSLALEYYDTALKSWGNGDNENAMFYLGATAHLIQDMTVPHHANIRLLDNHRQFESFIRRAYHNTPSFLVYKGGYYMESIEEFIKCNARTAMRIYSKLRYISEEEKRFYTITKFTLPLAQRTTAGCFMRFYRDITKAGVRESGVLQGVS